MATAALIWAAPALDDLDDLLAWIALQDPAAAADLATRVLERVEQLRRYPASGRWLPELSDRIYREVVVTPFRIVYRREGRGARARVVIVHVFRGERPLRRGRLS